MHGRTDNVKTVYPPQTKFAGGIIIVLQQKMKGNLAMKDCNIVTCTYAHTDRPLKLHVSNTGQPQVTLIVFSRPHSEWIFGNNIGRLRYASKQTLNY